MHRKTLNVLFITNMYPNKAQSHAGVFVKEQIEQLSMELETYEIINVSKRVNWFLRYGLTLPSVLREILSRRYNILHVHFGLTAVIVFPFILLIKIFRIRTVITFHGTDIVGKKSINRLVAAISKSAATLFDLSICVSDDIQKIISKYSKHVIKISCGIPSEFYNYKAKTERQNIVIFPSDPDRKEKNFELFKKVFNRVKYYCPNISFVCLKNMTKNEVNKHMTKSKCLLMTSLHEGSPQTVKEAIICDLPVVSTPVGDVPSLLKGLPGCAIGQNENELVDAVLSIIEASEEYKFPSEFKKKLSNAKSCKKIIHCYNQLIN